MASHLNPTQLLNRLRQPDEVGRDPFTVLQSISLLINNADTLPLGREMVLRALELRGSMGVVEPILDSLARSTGLFPYADPEALDLADRIAYEYHRPANMTEDVVFHRMQAEVYRRLLSGENVILSAPTSFGKSRVIDAMIATRQFKNVAVIVPTLALIDETAQGVLRPFRVTTKSSRISHSLQASGISLSSPPNAPLRTPGFQRSTFS